MYLERVGTTTDYKIIKIKFYWRIKMKFKQIKDLKEYVVSTKLSYVKDAFVWYKNEEGILFQVTDNKEIEKLNKLQGEFNGTV